MFSRDRRTDQVKINLTTVFWNTRVRTSSSYGSRTTEKKRATDGQLDSRLPQKLGRKQGQELKNWK
jgi:hypothetical protein